MNDASCTDYKRKTGIPTLKRSNFSHIVSCNSPSACADADLERQTSIFKQTLTSNNVGCKGKTGSSKCPHAPAAVFIMRGVIIACLFGLFLLLAQTTEPVRRCKSKDSNQSLKGCLRATEGDGFGNLTNLTDQHNNTNESRQNETAEETVLTQLLKTRAKRSKQEPDLNPGWVPFKGGTSGFALQSENEEKNTTERRLNETAEVLKANETMTGQTTQLPKTTKRTTARPSTTTTIVWFPFRSGQDAGFATKSEKEEGTV